MTMVEQFHMQELHGPCRSKSTLKFRGDTHVFHRYYNLYVRFAYIHWLVYVGGNEFIQCSTEHITTKSETTR